MSQATRHSSPGHNALVTRGAGSPYTPRMHKLAVLILAVSGCTLITDSSTSTVQPLVEDDGGLGFDEEPGGLAGTQSVDDGEPEDLGTPEPTGKGVSSVTTCGYSDCDLEFAECILRDDGWWDCIDIDECAAGTHDCAPGSNCINKHEAPVACSPTPG